MHNKENISFLITGSAGFIGFHLSKKLLDQGYRVVGIDNINDYYDTSLKKDRLFILNKYNNFIFSKEDISDDRCYKFLEGFDIDYVINLAAQAGVRYSILNPDVYMQSNIIGHFKIMKFCVEKNIKHFFYASSSSIYGNTNPPFNENQVTDTPVSLYGATKKSNEIISESFSKIYKLPITGFRFFTVYGPWGRPDMAYWSFTEKILNNKEIDVFNHGKLSRDFTYIDDIVSGVISCYKFRKFSSDHQIYNLGNNIPIKLNDFIEAIENKLKIKANKNMIKMQLGDVVSTHADISKANNDFGFNPVIEIHEGISKFIDWYLDWLN